MAPVFHDLANQFKDIMFCSVDVDKVKEAAQQARVTGLFVH